MANQPDKRQQFRFWYPFWGGASASAPASRPPATPTRPSPTNQSSRTQQPAAPADKRIPRTPSLSPSPSSSSSSSSSSSRATSSSPAKQSQPKRVSRTPSSSSQPSPTQSPSRRSPRSEQVKQKAKDEPTRGSKPSPPMTPATPSRSHSPSKGDDKSPEETSNQPKASQEQKATNTDESIETKANYSKTVDANNGSNIEKPITSPTLDVEKENNGSKDLEKKIEKENNGSKDLEKKIEAKSIHFDPITNDMPTETVIRDENPKKADEQDLKKTEVPSDTSTGNKDSETRPEEKKQAHDEIHQENSSTDTNHQKIDMMAPAAQDDSSKETIKEIAKPTPDGSPKETIKEVAQTTDVANLGSDHKSKNVTTDDNKFSDNKPDPIARENRVTKHPKQKEKIVAGTGSDNCDSTRTSFQKNIKDGISKLVQKINSNGVALNPGSERGASASIITLAGENKGASMYIGHENEGHTGNIAGRGHKLNGSSSSTAAATLSKGKEKIAIAKDGDDDEKDSKIAANVNSNVQSINNSMLQESSCDTRDPGVHLRFSSHLKRPKTMKKKMSDGDN